MENIKNFTKDTLYELHVDSIREMPDGRKYIYFQEKYDGMELRVRAREYQTTPDTILPRTIIVKVLDFYPMSGQPVFAISRKWILEDLYGDESLPKKFVFQIIEKDEVHSSFKLKDSYGEIHWLPVDRNKLDIYDSGNNISLFVDSIVPQPNKCVDGARLQLRLVNDQQDTIKQYDYIFTTRESNPDTQETFKVERTHNTYNFGEENQTTEFKSSIVFSPKEKDVPNITGQSFNIAKTIAGFMNSDGGILYIGVRNDGSPCGVEHDFDHINSDDSDFNQYTKDIDGYENKIRTIIEKNLGSRFIGGLINFSHKEYDDKTVVALDIKRAWKPIFVNNKYLFQRQGNRTQSLSGNDVTEYILSRMKGDEIEAFLAHQYEANSQNQDDNEQGNTDISNYTLIDDERNHNLWWNLYLLSDGSYRVTKKTSNDHNIVAGITLEQYHKNEKQVLLLIYDCNKVNKIDFGRGTESWHSAKGDGRQTAAPWVQSKIDKLICVDRHDMLATFYKEDDRAYVSIEDIDQIDLSQKNPDRALFNQGHKLIPENVKNVQDVRIVHIPANYRPWIASIVNKKRLSLNDQHKRKTIAQLLDIVKDIQMKQA